MVEWERAAWNGGYSRDVHETFSDETRDVRDVGDCVRDETETLQVAETFGEKQ